MTFSNYQSDHTSAGKHNWRSNIETVDSQAGGGGAYRVYLWTFQVLDGDHSVPTPCKGKAHTDG